jgi:sec-independent protein translocase protein TatA
MGSFSIWHWALVVLVIVLLFGRGKISDLMGDVAKGIKSFKKGLAEDEPTAVSSGTSSIEQKVSTKAAAELAKS